LSFNYDNDKNVDLESLKIKSSLLTYKW